MPISKQLLLKVQQFSQYTQKLLQVHKMTTSSYKYCSNLSVLQSMNHYRFLPHKTNAKSELTIAAFTGVRSIDIVYFVHDLCRVRLIAVNDNHNICMSHLPASTHSNHSSALILNTTTDLKWDYSRHIHAKTICITIYSKLFCLVPICSSENSQVYMPRIYLCNKKLIVGD